MAKFIQQIFCLHFQMTCINPRIAAEPFFLCNFFVHNQLNIISSSLINPMTDADPGFVPRCSSISLLRQMKDAVLRFFTQCVRIQRFVCRKHDQKETRFFLLHKKMLFRISVPSALSISSHSSIVSTTSLSTLS